MNQQWKWHCKNVSVIVNTILSIIMYSKRCMRQILIPPTDFSLKLSYQCLVHIKKKEMAKSLKRKSLEHIQLHGRPFPKEIILHLHVMKIKSSSPSFLFILNNHPLGFFFSQQFGNKLYQEKTYDQISYEIKDVSVKRFWIKIDDILHVF